jgi:hypothetical protein
LKKEKEKKKRGGCQSGVVESPPWQEKKNSLGVAELPQRLKPINFFFFLLLLLLFFLPWGEPPHGKTKEWLGTPFLFLFFFFSNFLLFLINF